MGFFKDRVFLPLFFFVLSLGEPIFSGLHRREGGREGGKGKERRGEDRERTLTNEGEN